MATQLDDALNAAKKGEFELAYKIFLPLAEQGNTAAQNFIGYMFQRGDGVERNDIQAAKWWRLAAENGLADAQNNLGVIFAEGKGVTQSDVESAKWGTAMANQGAGGGMHGGLQNKLLSKGADIHVSELNSMCPMTYYSRYHSFFS